ncbi:hypothetical protein HZH68_015709 [Vespula germanica]|uniref:Uncharacterized protein n=1 Tax=Vespula germanica TaxID=30212 RepID=A0A834J669_VESGE|nr:hypothetical protein HZH68_015709 [Vespula germanica]
MANLKMHLDKCEFLKSKFIYLGHIIVENGVKPDAKKLESEGTIRITQNLVESHNRLSMRKDNVAIFITIHGKSYGERAKQLINLGKLSAYRDLTLDRACVTDIGSKQLIALPMKKTNNTILNMALLSIVWELNYLNVRTLNSEDHENLIRENYSSALGNHKGVIKTITDIPCRLTTLFSHWRSHHLYGYNLLRSEHSKLFILETSKGRTSATKIKLFVEGLDLFSYLISKLVYLEKHLRNQIAVYNAIAIECLGILTLYVMKSAIYMAVTAGEVLHIVMCIPIAIKVTDNEECYHELLIYQ